MSSAGAFRHLPSPRSLCSLFQRSQPQRSFPHTHIHTEGEASGTRAKRGGECRWAISWCVAAALAPATQAHTRTHNTHTHTRARGLTHTTHNYARFDSHHFTHTHTETNTQTHTLTTHTHTHRHGWACVVTVFLLVPRAHLRRLHFCP